MPQLRKACRIGDTEKAVTLINAGADPNSAGEGGRTAMHWVCAQGHVDCCLAMLKLGGDINKKDEWGYSPLDLATDRGHTELFELLKAVSAGKSGEDLQSLIDSAQAAFQKTKEEKELLALEKQKEEENQRRLEEERQKELAEQKARMEEEENKLRVEREKLEEEMRKLNLTIEKKRLEEIDLQKKRVAFVKQNYCLTEVEKPLFSAELKEKLSDLDNMQEKIANSHSAAAIMKLLEDIAVVALLEQTSGNAGTSPEVVACGERDDGEEEGGIIKLNEDCEKEVTAYLELDIQIAQLLETEKNNTNALSLAEKRNQHWKTALTNLRKLSSISEKVEERRKNEFLLSDPFLHTLNKILSNAFGVDLATATLTDGVSEAKAVEAFAQWAASVHDSLLEPFAQAHTLVEQLTTVVDQIMASFPTVVENGETLIKDIVASGVNRGLRLKTLICKERLDAIRKQEEQAKQNCADLIVDLEGLEQAETLLLQRERELADTTAAFRSARKEYRLAQAAEDDDDLAPDALAQARALTKEKEKLMNEADLKRELAQLLVDEAAAQHFPERALN